MSNIPQISLPTINLNGSPGDRLGEEYYLVARTVESAMRKMQEFVSPHPRDYISDAAYQDANKEHVTRMKALANVFNELAAISESCYLQHEERVSSRARRI